MTVHVRFPANSSEDRNAGMSNVQLGFSQFRSEQQCYMTTVASDRK